MHHSTIELPTYWANALINNDWLSIEDIAERNRAFAKANELNKQGWEICDIEDSYFSRSYRHADPDSRYTEGMLSVYVIIR